MEKVSPDILYVYNVEITIVTLCTNVLLFLYVLCWIWWYWRDVLVLRCNSREWQMGDGISWLKNSGQYSSGVMIWSVKSPPTVFLYWRLVFVTFGCVTLPRRFRLGIVFGGEVWRSATRLTRCCVLLTCARQFLLWAYITSCLFTVLFTFVVDIESYGVDFTRRFRFAPSVMAGKLVSSVFWKRWF